MAENSWHDIRFWQKKALREYNSKSVINAKRVGEYDSKSVINAKRVREYDSKSVINNTLAIILA